ncbi:MAG: four helix bundle protein [Chitinophagaceae bacterium]
MQTNKENIIVDLSYAFAKEIVNLSEFLYESRKFVIANQLLKSGTSIGANIREAQNGQSIPDFIHKFKIAAKEADETEYWLMLCRDCYNIESCQELLSKLTVIQKIVSKIIASSIESEKAAKQK